MIYKSIFCVCITVNTARLSIIQKINNQFNSYNGSHVIHYLSQQNLIQVICGEVAI